MAIAGPSRRDLMLGAGSLAGLVAADRLPALAGAPLRAVQMPGHYRFMVGEIEITVLSDGTFTVPLEFSAGNVPEAELRTYLEALHYQPDNHVRHMNFVLINTGGRLVLLDPGAGPDFRATSGKLLGNLAAAGYRPDEVDRVAITHAHPDHVWGLMDFFEEAPTFPNADYVMLAAEWEFWSAEDSASRLPASLESFAVGARNQLLPVAERIERVTGEVEIAPGVFTLPSPGHTPGHLSLLVASGGEQLLIAGDAFYHPYITFEHPDWRPLLDMEPETAVETRKHLAARAADERMSVVAFHFPFPGLGHVARRGGRLAWVPANWSW